MREGTRRLLTALYPISLFGVIFAINIDNHCLDCLVGSLLIALFSCSLALTALYFCNLFFESRSAGWLTDTKKISLKQRRKSDVAEACRLVGQND